MILYFQLVQYSKLYLNEMLILYSWSIPNFLPGIGLPFFLVIIPEVFKPKSFIKTKIFKISMFGLICNEFITIFRLMFLLE